MKIFNRKKTAAIISFFAVLTVILTVMCMATSFAAGPKYTQKEVDINVSVGYSSDRLIPGKIVPVYVTVKNNTKDDITGTLYLSFETTDIQKEYSRDFVLPAGVEKTVDFAAYFQYGFYYYRENVNCRIESTNGRLLAEKTSLYQNTMNNESKMVGWMTEDPSEPNPAKILQNEILSMTGGEILVEKLTPDYFPSNEAMIDEFDVIFVNNVDFSGSSAYTAEQLALLDHYIADGGIVILGTGSKNDANLTGFSKYFNGKTSDACFPIGENTVSDNFIGSYFDNYKQKMFIELKDIPLCEITDYNFEKLGKDETSLIFAHKKYNIFITEFALDDGIFTNESDGFLYLLSEICTADSDAFNKILEPFPYRQSFDDFLKYDDQNRMPKAWVILVIMASYIVLAIILPFIILKKKKKSQYFWITVPAAALIFSGIIFLYGQFLHGRSMSNTFKLVKINETGANKTLIRTEWYSSKSGKENLSIGEEDCLFVDNYMLNNSSSYNYDRMNSSYNYGSETYQKFNAVKGSFITSDAVYTDRTYKPLTAKASADLLNDTVSVEVENTSGRNLSDVFVVAYDTTIIIGDLKAGEKFSATESTFQQIHNLTDFTIEDMKLIAEFCYKEIGLDPNLAYAESASQTGMYFLDNTSKYYKSLKKDPDIYRRAWILANLSSVMTGKNYGDAYVFAFDDSDDTTVTVNGKEASKKYSNTLVYQEISLEMISGGVPAGYSVKAEMMKPSDYDSLNFRTSFKEDGSGRLMFCPGYKEKKDLLYCLKVPSNMGMSFEKITFEFPDDTAFIPDVMMYNVMSDQFEEIELESGEAEFNSRLYFVRNTENMTDYNIKGEYKYVNLGPDFLTVEYYDDDGEYSYCSYPDTYGSGFFQGCNAIIIALRYDSEEVNEYLSENKSKEGGVLVPDMFDVRIEQ